MTEQQAAQRVDLVNLVNKALGFRVSADGGGAYHLERLYWFGEGQHEMTRVTSVRPATVDEYRMYVLLCSPQADWAGEDDGQAG